jgi:transposase InsO family protein
MPIARVFIPREDREGLRRAGRFHDDRGARRAGFSHDRRLQEASSAGAGEAVFAGAEAGGKSRDGERETELRAEVDRWLEAAEAADAQEDKLHGASRRGDEMPGWIADKQKRLAKIREAREALDGLDRQFTADQPNRKWIADFTYVWTAEGWL